MKMRQCLVMLAIGLFAVLANGVQKKIYVDCTGNNGGSGWNNVSIVTSNATAVLADFAGKDTGISITVSNRMTAQTSAVSSGSYTGDALEFLQSGNNGAFGSVNSWSGNPPCLHADLVFSGLDTNVAYSFTYFASRNNDGTGWSREGEYTLTGASTVTNYLDAADNFSEVSISDPVYPDASGVIVLTIKPGPNNTADNNYFYLNAFKIEYSPVPVLDDPEVIYIDPTSGAGYIGSGWNGLNFASTGANVNLTTTNDSPSGIKATVITRLTAVNTSGSSSPTGDAAEFATAGANSIYGSDQEFSGYTTPLGEIRFEGLATNIAYTFTMYASRMGVTDIRDAEYTFSGANTNSAVLDAANNSSEVVIVSDVYPDASGVIDFSMTSGPDNNNSYGFYYLSAMKIEYAPYARELADDIYVDVAVSNSGANWNQISANVQGSSAVLISSSGESTEYRIYVERAVNPGYNNSATASPIEDAAEFQPMQTENAYGQDGAYSQGVFKLSNLNPAYHYDFTFYASRMGVTDNREALYTVSGFTTGSAALDSANNSNKVCTVVGVRPNAYGEMEITFRKGSNNDNSAGYFYLGAMKISSYEIYGTVAPSLPSTAKRLLFFGDSFSATHDIPGLVQSLAVVAGYDRPLVASDLDLGADVATHLSEVVDSPLNNVDSVLLPVGDTWDHVIVQGDGEEACALGAPAEFQTNSLSLYQQIKNHASGKGATAEALLFETWAAEDGYAYYPSSFADPAAMQLDLRTNYNAAVSMINAFEGAGSARVAGVGDAFETGDFYYALYDGGFEESEYGAYLAAMVLYKKIYNEDATNLSYSAALAADWTSMAESDWDMLTMWADGVSTPFDDPGKSETIYVDTFGGDGPTIWNNFSFNQTGSPVELRDTATRLTGIYLSITNRLENGGVYGSSSPSGDAAEFAPAGNTGAHGNDSFPSCDALITGLNPGRRYEFTFYGSRDGITTDNRDTLFSLTGSTQVSAHLNVSDNSTEVRVLSVNPDSNGSILLRVSKGPDNDNADGLYYITAFKIKSSGFGSVMVLQ